jgi:DNA-binding NarL/FixJ family response regulator
MTIIWMMTTTKSNVIVFCRENLRRAAWVALLEKQPGISAVFTAATLPELQALAVPGNYHSLLVDWPEIDSTFVSQLTTTVPGGGLLILVEDYDLKEAISFLQAGATGLISRDASVTELVRAIVAVGRDEIVLPPDMASKVMLALARGDHWPQQAVETLTDREKEVLTLLAQGLTNKDIAQSLFLSVRTIETHLRNIYGKLNVSSRTEAVLWAVQHGYEP